MKIKALKAFTVYDSQTKDFLSIGHGQIAEVDSDLAAQLISAGLAEKVTEGSGGSDIVKGLVERTITNVTADMLEGVTNIRDSAFSDCTSLTSIEIPNSVTSIGGGAFYSCTSLTSIEIPNSVTSIGASAFRGCASLASVEISSNVTEIEGWAFRSCTSLTSIEIPNSVTNIGDNAFLGCSSLASVTVLATTPPTLGSVVFPSLSEFYVPAESVEAYKAASSWSSYASRINAIPS